MSAVVSRWMLVAVRSCVTQEATEEWQTDGRDAARGEGGDCVSPNCVDGCVALLSGYVHVGNARGGSVRGAIALRDPVGVDATGALCVYRRDKCVCAQFLESQLHVSNALGLHEFATSVGCLELARKTQVFVDRNFSEIVKHDELLSLSPAQLMGLIQRDEIHVRSEAEVYNAVVRWVNHDKANRLASLMECLGLVRCHALAPGFIRNQIKNCGLLAEVPQSRLHMQSVLSDLLQHKNVPVRWRADAHAQMIYSAGGYLRYSLSNFEAYNRVTDTWRRLPDVPSPRSDLAAASVRGCIYLVGGRNNNNEQSNVDAPHMDCYDPTTNRWHTCAPCRCPGIVWQWEWWMT
ncbi:Kelch-like ECH-associated protein 1 [Taenia crassiceps]|uniref:Kelch-like ECH-associated protein 1 n=1 Tax=Taenia crassiceps TaxID=6207 RepID=A0ABR4Q7H3_9CEST